MTARLMQAIANRDGATLAHIAGRAPAHSCSNAGVVNGEAARLVDSLFRQLKQVFPAAAATNLRTEADEAAAKKQWIAAFAENGIRSREQLSDGMKFARASKSPFWPSPGQFIAWCHDGALHRAGLPTPAELADMVMKYCARRGFYNAPADYPWQHPAHYWMVTSLYSEMRYQCWTEADLVEHAKSELSKMARRIARGEAIPEPVPMLEVPQPQPVSPERGREIIAELRRNILNKSRKNI
ncbi:replication protein P [Mixta calida]